MKSSALAIAIVCWTGRILALGLFLFWGAFFLEHIEWFAHPSKGLPPVWVWLQMLAHLAILVGLAALWRWELAGGLLTILAATAFFSGLALREAAAGHRYATFLVFLAVTIIPAVLSLVCCFARTRALSLQQ